MLLKNYVIKYHYTNKRSEMYPPLITHVLLFDEDKPDYIVKLASNTKMISDCFNELFSSDGKIPYYVILAIPDSTSLTNYCEFIRDQLKMMNINVRMAKINMARERDEKLFGDEYIFGKVGLLHCIRQYILGSILLNEISLSKHQAEALLKYASKVWLSPMKNQREDRLVLIKKGFFKYEYGIGFIRSQCDLYDFLFRKSCYLKDQHTVTDIIRLLKANCRNKEIVYIS